MSDFKYNAPQFFDFHAKDNNNANSSFEAYFGKIF